MKKWNVWEIEVKTGARRIRIRTYYGLTSAYDFMGSLVARNLKDVASGKDSKKEYFVEEEA